MDKKNDDDVQLARMGHKPELQRNFSTLYYLYSSESGLVTAGTCNLCIAASLAEFLSAYPTAGGQYHWVAVSWPQWIPILSWITGWINVAGWIALVATNALLSSQLIAGIVSAVYPDFVWQRWQQFLIYVAYTALAFVVNAFMNSVLPIIYRGAYGMAGWSRLVVGEVPQPSIRGPKIMVTCVGIGTFTGAVFLIVLLFVAGDINEVINSSAGPLLQIFLHATKNTAGMAASPPRDSSLAYIQNLDSP
ncbi:hypothetical protein EYZ11_009057 [Aspergillus tanneri]|uniref:Amino acid permease/ SLC12A domain-containing protein n=1 Tax=Aspergillus tanneri TaxID=1220188 RepID=A0A4V3UNK0_9EURO|nr:hypothetical protein EYZ11_009057 [Aspergillus tanneri]